MDNLRQLDFSVEKAILKSAYGSEIRTFTNVSELPINSNRDYYESNLGILYIHKGEGKLPLELARKPLLYLKQALLHENFLKELDKALVGDNYDRYFTNAVKEFEIINDYDKKIQHSEFNEVISQFLAKIS